MYLSTDGNVLSNSERLGLTEISRDHFMEQIIHFPTCGMNTLDLIVTYILGLVSNCHSPEKFSDHDAEACTLNATLPFVGKPKDAIDQFRYIKLQSKTKGIISRLWGINSYKSLYLFPRASR